jgi:hypothetical protein
MIPGAGACANCKAPASLNALLCRACYRELPVGLRRELWSTVRRFYRSKASLAELRAVQGRCVESLGGRLEVDL